MVSRVIGATLLVIGTCIGAGLLALPIATANVGFAGSVLLLLFCWLMMTLSAFLTLEVNIHMPLNNNMITMAGRTIGPWSQVLAWITYLLLLYSLLCAYIAGGSDLLHSSLEMTNFSIPPSLATVLFTLILGLVVLLGTRSIDYANRGFMIIKFLSFFVLLGLLLPHAHSHHLTNSNLTQSLWTLGFSTALMVTITSFGFSPIIPSLNIYLKGNIRQLKWVIMVGSIIPLICYIAWDAAVMGVLPLKGPNSLTSVLQSNNQTSGLVALLSTTVPNSEMIPIIVKCFTGVCMLTSFLGVSLCLTDFLADGFSLEKKGWQNVFINALTFLPPIAIVIFFPNIFVKALAYAGVYCLILMVFLPSLMVIFYRKKAATHSGSGSAPQFQVPGGNSLLYALILFSCAMLAWVMLS